MPQYDEFEKSALRRKAAVDAALRGLRGDDFEDFKLPEAPPAPEPELSMAAKYLPLAVRGVGGFIGSAPGVGALGGLGSEVAAQGLEQYFGTREDFSPLEIASATALGAAGGGMLKLIGSAPNALNAAVRAGAVGAAMPAIRSGIEKGELPEAKDVAISAALSAGTGGLLGHYLGAGRAAKEGAEAAHQIDFTNQSLKPRTIKGTGAPIGDVVTDVEQGAGRGYSRAGYAETPEDLAQMPKAKRAARQESADVRREQMDLERLSKAERKLADEARAAEEIELAKAQGLEPVDSISQRMSTPIEGGTETLTRRFVRPAEEEADDAANELGNMLGGKKGKGGKGKAKATKAAQAPSTLQSVLGAGPAVTAERAAIDAISGPGAAANAEARIAAQDFTPTPEASQMLSSPSAIEVPANVGQGFGPGAAFSTAPNAPEDLLGALRGLAGRRAPKTIPEATPSTGLAPEGPIAPQRGAAAQVIEDLPADITQRPGYTPGPALKGGGGQLAKMTEASAGDDRFGAYLRATGREELDLAAERAKMPTTFGTGVDAPILPSEPVAAPLGAETTIPMSAVGRGQLPVSSQHYNELQKLFKSDKTSMPKEAPRVAGRALQRIGRESEEVIPQAQQGLPTQPVAAPKPPAPTAAPPAAPTGESAFGANASPALRDFFRNLAREGPRPGRPSSGMGPSTGGGSGFGRGGGEAGFASPELLVHAGSTIAGAGVGSMLNEDDPIMGALGGAAVGAGLSAAAFKIAPHMPSIMSSPTLESGTKQVLSQLGTPEGMKQAAVEVLNRIPTTLRANLLWSPNIINNAIVGPYGAALAAASERHLAGDPRAAEFLKSLSPANWARAYRESLDEAATHLGEAERAGGHLTANANNAYDVYTALPGTWMHAGDLATRRLGIMAGFTEEEMKGFTMTAEPEFKTTKWIANFPRTGIAGQVLLPFARTAANAIEQGSFRTPGLGYLMQALRENPDPMAVQHVQQLLGAGTLGAGYVGGQSEDELSNSLGVPPSVVRAFVRNIAGPYSVLSSSGYAAGKAMDASNDSHKAAFTGAKAYFNETPLPTTQVPLDYVNFLEKPGIKTVPAGIAPKGLIDFLNPEKGKGRPNAPKRPTRPQRPGE